MNKVGISFDEMKADLMKDDNIFRLIREPISPN